MIGGLRPAVHPRHWGLRVRGTLIVVTVVTFAVAVCAATMTVLLYRSLRSAADAAAATRIREVAAQLALDTPHELDRSVLATDARLTGVQIIDPGGRVVQRSLEAPAQPLTPVRPAAGETIVDAPAARSDDDGRLTASTVVSAGEPYTIVVAVDSDEIEDTIALVLALFGLGGPVIVGAAATATYLMVGRSLRSVEVIRRRVAAITSTDLGQRVPIPLPKDEIAALAVTMNDMLERIDVGHTAQRRFTSDASHELRSPLTTISTVLQLARTSAGDIDSETVETVLLPESERMRRLVEDLLLLARADERGIAPRLTDIDLDYLVTSETTRIRADTNVTLRTSVVPVRIVGDEPALGRAIRNVLDNAVRYARTTVSVGLTATDGFASITVGDDGPGIDPGDRDKVFDRFYRPDTARARGSGGSGLGLAIVREIVAAHRGRVGLESSAGDGTTVTIELPRHPPGRAG